MDKLAIIAKINNALSEEFELDSEQMVPEASIRDDLGLDSLDIVDMVIVLEKAFNFKLKNKEALVRIRTLGDIHDYIITIHQANGADAN